MRITYHGHSCFEITGCLNLVIDPHDGDSLGLMRPSVVGDVVAVTHEHFDHNKVEAVSAPHTQIVKGEGEFEFSGLKITGIGAFHDGVKGRRLGRVTMYRFTMDGITCLHAGDLGEIPGEDMLEKIGKIDILFLPVGGKFTLDSERAIEVMSLIKPSVTVPMHYHLPGLTLEIDGVKPFLEGVGLPVYRPGHAIDFDREDLPEEREIWVFDY